LGRRGSSELRSRFSLLKTLIDSRGDVLIDSVILVALEVSVGVAVVPAPATAAVSVATEIADEEDGALRVAVEGMETEFVPGIGKAPIMAETRKSENEIVKRRCVIFFLVVFFFALCVLWMKYGKSKKVSLFYLLWKQSVEG
jgi:hypothetical protein